MENQFDYAKIKDKIYDYYCHTIASLSRICDISEKRLRNFFNPEIKHNAYKDMYIIEKIAFALKTEVNELLA